MARPWVRMALAVAAMNRRAPGVFDKGFLYLATRGLVYTGSGALRAGDPRGRWNAFRAIADSARMDAMPVDPRDPPAFSLSQFEWLVHRRQHEAAGRLLLLGLRRLDERHGALPAGLSEDARAHFLARWAAAIGALFADPDFQVSRDGFEQFLTLQRWLAAIFGATPFGHADHVIAALAGATPARGGGLALGPGDLLKYCVLCLPDSELDVPLDALWAHDARAAAGLCIAQLAARQMVTPSACARRETMLRWLPRRLAQLPDLRGLPTAVLHDAYMHCSYALAADKHDIKREINRLLRQRLADGLDDMRAHPPRRARPDAGGAGGILGAAFPVSHALVDLARGARPLRAARSGDGRRRRCGRADGFRSLPQPVAAGCGGAGRGAGARTPARHHLLPKHRPVAAGGPAEQSAPGAAAARRRRPSRDHARAKHRRHAGRGRHAGRCRVLQRARGHAAQGLRGACAAARFPGPARAAWRGEPGSGSGTPAARRRLRDLAEVERPLPGDLPAYRRARVQGRAIPFLRWRLPGRGARGPAAHGDRRRAASPGARMPYEDYLARLRGCDLFLDPFPYGNTNSIVDTVSQGLPGVCMTGREVHERLDAALFRRLGLPESLIAADAGQYERAAIELIDDARGRAALTAMILGNGGADALFQGRPERFGPIVERLLAQARAAGPDMSR